ncbi:MAG: hypothetical protein QOF00_1557 [Pseudonocardiales bacterium]|nr:hypothetical protein [Pseudonocardiales bacterium]
MNSLRGAVGAVARAQSNIRRVFSGRLNTISSTGASTLASIVSYPTVQCATNLCGEGPEGFKTIPTIMLPIDAAKSRSR